MKESKNKNLRETGRRLNNPVTYAVLAFSAIFFVPSLLMDYIWINLKEVTLESPAIHGDPIIMRVDREIHREFRGTFKVQVRRLDGEMVCEGRPDSPFPYMPGTDLPVPLVLTWWLGGQDQMDYCRSQGFTTGEFFVDTCHSKVITTLDLPLATRCVRSNTITIIERSEDE